MKLLRRKIEIIVSNFVALMGFIVASDVLNYSDDEKTALLQKTGVAIACASLIPLILHIINPRIRIKLSITEIAFGPNQPGYEVFRSPHTICLAGDGTFWLRVQVDLELPALVPAAALERCMQWPLKGVQIQFAPWDRLSVAVERSNGMQATVEYSGRRDLLLETVPGQRGGLVGGADLEISVDPNFVPSRLFLDARLRPARFKLIAWPAMKLLFVIDCPASELEWRP